MPEIEHLLTQRHTQWHGWQDGTLQQFNLALAQQYKTPGAPAVLIPEILRSLIQYSSKYYRLSEGRFNPAIGQLVQAWGFHQQSSPDKNLINKIKKNVPGMQDLIVKDNHATIRNPYLKLDFGAIAKGMAVQQVAQLLDKKDIHNYIINAGGDVFARGQKPGGPWQVAIENPFYSEHKTNRIIARIAVNKPTSIFTSGNYHRFYIDDNNHKRHHIIDPSTGEPSTTISAITVMHKNPVIADIAATTLMLTRVSELKKMADKLAIDDFLAITEQKQLYISHSMMKKLEWIQTTGLTKHLL